MAPKNPQIHPYITPQLFARLEAECKARPKVTISEIVEEALTRLFDPNWQDMSRVHAMQAQLTMIWDLLRHHLGTEETPPLPTSTPPFIVREYPGGLQQYVEEQQAGQADDASEAPGENGTTPLVPPPDVWRGVMDGVYGKNWLEKEESPPLAEAVTPLPPQKKRPWYRR